MSLTLLNLHNLSILRQALTAENAQANELLENLPNELKNRIQDRISGSAEASSQAPMSLAIKEITLALIEEQTTDHKDKIYAIFHQVCVESHTVNNDSFMHHIADDDKIDQLFDSVEMVETTNILDAWAGSDRNKLRAKEKIIEFIKNKQKTELDLSGLRLDTLPDIFMNNELKKRIKKLDLKFNYLTSIPGSIGNLLNLETISLTSNLLESLPESIGNLVRLKHLFLTNNRLQGLPASIGNLENLDALFVRENQLQSIPASIGNLRALRSLDLTKNILTINPNSILQLHQDCIVDLRDTSLSRAALISLRRASSTEGYNGPSRIFFPIEEVPINLQAYPSIEVAFSSICQKAGISKASSFEELYPNMHQFMNEDHRQNLIDWLSRLSWMKDAQTEAEARLYRTILSYLALAEDDEKFRDKFFPIIVVAAETCGDRMALSIIELGIEHKCLHIDKTDLKSLSDFLINGPWKLKQLEHIAKEKIAVLKNIRDLRQQSSFDRIDEIDEIEVYLAYPVMLKERLELPIDIEEMLFFGVSGVTKQDLDHAEKSIKDMLKEPDAMARELLKMQDWTDALETHRKTAPGVAAFKRQRNHNLEKVEETADDKQDKAVALQEEYEKDLLDMTKKVLRK